MNRRFLTISIVLLVSAIVGGCIHANSLNRQMEDSERPEPVFTIYGRDGGALLLATNWTVPPSVNPRDEAAASRAQELVLNWRDPVPHTWAVIAFSLGSEGLVFEGAIGSAPATKYEFEGNSVVQTPSLTSRGGSLYLDRQLIAWDDQGPIARASEAFWPRVNEGADVLLLVLAVSSSTVELDLPTANGHEPYIREVANASTTVEVEYWKRRLTDPASHEVVTTIPQVQDTTDAAANIAASSEFDLSAPSGLGLFGLSSFVWHGVSRTTFDGTLGGVPLAIDEVALPELDGGGTPRGREWGLLVAGEGPTASQLSVVHGELPTSSFAQWVWIRAELGLELLSGLGIEQVLDVRKTPDPQANDSGSNHST